MVLTRETYRQFAQFVIVGTLNTTISYSIFVSLYLGLRVNYLLAGATATSIACITGFFMNRAFTFTSDIPISSGSFKYIQVQVLCVVVHSCIQYTATEYLGIIPLISQLMGVAVTMFINFILSKIYVFKSATSSVG